MQNEELKIDSLDKLYFSAFQFTAEVTEDIFISEYKGATFRGGFGKSFKRLVCINPEENDCYKCIVNKNCSYHKIFNSNIDAETSQRLNIAATAPRPFVIEPPMTNQRKYTKGDQFTFNLILIGWAIEYLPYFIIVFERLGERFGIGKITEEGKRGKFFITSVKCSGRSIYTHKTKYLSTNFKPKTVVDLLPLRSTYKIRINFLTPTRLEINHERQLLNKQDDFLTFIIRLYNRLFSLQEIYCKENTLIEYSHKDLETEARKVKLLYSNLIWQDLERYTRINKEEGNEKDIMKYGGFVGDVMFEGNLEPFLNMIALGEVLHVGKYYTFGLGKYEILSIT
ncbi:MAG: CRISPR system precrRNA processing endoribonuclease RAMP protein Cas6 [Bacteroidetes bacterium]|nr:CRISPR system precrRNA processing endoribonuclease RAMP protein Cas6 [Bacteroidota bacterium]